MDTNKVLLALEALDVSVLLKNMSDHAAFELVINLIKTSRDVEESIQDYFDYLWGEFANDDPWEKAIEKHTPHKTAIHKLEEQLLTFIMQNVWSNKDIPLLVTEETPIDIKSLVFEMSHIDGVELLNKLIGLAEDKIEYMELRTIHGEGLSEELQSNYDKLADLRDKMQDIVNEQEELNRQWEAYAHKCEIEKAKEIAEKTEELNLLESKRVEENKVLVTSVANADIA